jgi:hypothetical protein
LFFKDKETAYDNAYKLSMSVECLCWWSKCYKNTRQNTKIRPGVDGLWYSALFLPKFNEYWKNTQIVKPLKNKGKDNFWPLVKHQLIPKI